MNLKKKNEQGSSPSQPGYSSLPEYKTAGRSEESMHIKQIEDQIDIKLKSNLVSKNEDNSIEKNSKGPVTSKSDEQGFAIIGLSCRFPGASNADEFWYNLKDGVDSITEIPEGRWSEKDWFNPDKNSLNTSYTKWGGFLDNVDKFDPLFFNISPAEAEFIEPQQRIFLEEAWKTFEDAGYSLEVLNEKKCGVFVGAIGGDYVKRLSEAALSTSGQALMGTSSAILAARISYFLNLTGPAVTIETACSSSLVAIHQACQSLNTGESDLALAGGVTLMLTPLLHIMTSQVGMPSPEGRCKTFDKSASGIVSGEGCGVVLLKRYNDAVRDNDNIYAVIKGSGINQDGKTNGITAPNRLSQLGLQTGVYAKFKINPRTISYVEAHGTATPLGDPIEVEALTDSFFEYTPDKQFCAIGSVKTNIGHTGWAAGVAGVIKAVLCLKNKKLVPSLHYQQSNENIDFENSPFYVNTKLKDWTTDDSSLRMAAVNSFGISGTNAHMVIEEAPQRVAQYPEFKKPSYLICLSAKTMKALDQRLKDLQGYLQRISRVVSSVSEKSLLANMSYTLLSGRSHFNHRCAIVVKDLIHLKETLRGAIEQKSAKNVLRNSIVRQDRKQIALKKYGNQLIETLSVSNEEDYQSYQDNLLALADLYAQGYELAWEPLFKEGIHLRIPLPTYPFARERYWVPERPKLLLREMAVCPYCIHYWGATHLI
ncbi:type I polyketide synthase [Candidatus Scalindua japonica]|uniref:type I polyketide synthase n=1 Tax=Candidatus Scalindua japonica TaxID=1284222 RepID=UPI0013A5A4FC|nr:type I polyketide synthase [Candidatus Scalindua japonica]